MGWIVVKRLHEETRVVETDKKRMDLVRDAMKEVNAKVLAATALLQERKLKTLLGEEPARQIYVANIATSLDAPENIFGLQGTIVLGKMQNGEFVALDKTVEAVVLSALVDEEWTKELEERAENAIAVVRLLGEGSAEG